MASINYTQCIKCGRRYSSERQICIDCSSECRKSDANVIAKEKKLLFESGPCGRCGGSGQYSYCQMYGTMCFQCRGKGNTLTKRGAAAQAYFNELLTIAIEKVKEGDLIESQGNWSAVVAAAYVDENGSRYLSKKNGVEEWKPFVSVRTFRCLHQFYPGQRIVRRNPEAVKNAREHALAYQETLNERGKVLKRKMKV